MTQLSTIAALFAPLFGRAVEVTDKNGDVARYTITKLGDKLGTLKSGEKAEYVILTRDGDTGVIMSLHPTHATRLAKNGEDSGIKLLDEMSAQEQADAQAELAAEQNGNAGAPEAAPAGDAKAAKKGKKAAKKAEVPAEAKEPSKKERTIAMFKLMTADGKVRKDIIASMKSELGLSAACANTYYQNAKSGLWA